MLIDAMSAMIFELTGPRAGSRRSRATWLAALLAICCSEVALCADLLVAQVAPQSGPRGPLASEYRAGARLYFDNVNAAGGINGATIVLEARDDSGDPAVARRHATELITRKPIAFIGAVGAVNVLSVLPLLEASQTALVGPLVDAAGVDETDNRAVFHIRPNERQEIEAIVGRLESLGFGRIAVCHLDRPATVEIARSIRLQGARQELQSLGCGGDAAQVEAAVNALIRAGSQAVVFAGQTEAAATFIKTLRARSSFAMVVVSSSIDVRQLAAMLPIAAKKWLAVAEVFPNPGSDERSPGISVIREFSTLRAASSLRVPPSSASLAGFVAAKILVEALRRSGKNPAAADVLRSLRALQQYDAGGIAFDFSRIEPAPFTYTRLGVIDTRGAVLN
jgi:branched-chain amino acid transport system substrate-binding protein